MSNTPGPWVIEYKPRYRHYVHGPDHNAICKMSDSRETEETKANAHLISAAPDLLEALKTITEAFDATFDPNRRRQALEDAKQAILKAEGK